jgi:phosphopantothenate synthetase
MAKIENGVAGGGVSIAAAAAKIMKALENTISLNGENQALCRRGAMNINGGIENINNGRKRK